MASFASLVPYMWFCVIAVRQLLRDARIPTTPTTPTTLVA
jgi:hypothetical protein